MRRMYRLGAGRKARSRRKQNLIWVAVGTGVEIGGTGTNASRVLLTPGDWSGTVTDQHCWLQRICLFVHCYAVDWVAATPHDFSVPYVIHKSVTSVNDGDAHLSTNPLCNYSTWPDWFAENDEVVHIGETSCRAEDATWVISEECWPASFNTNFPDAYRNLRVKRKMSPTETLRITFGPGPNVSAASFIAEVFARILVVLA